MPYQSQNELVLVKMCEAALAIYISVTAQWRPISHRALSATVSVGSQRIIEMRRTYDIKQEQLRINGWECLRVSKL